MNDNRDLPSGNMHNLVQYGPYVLARRNGGRLLYRIYRDEVHVLTYRLPHIDSLRLDGMMMHARGGFCLNIFWPELQAMDVMRGVLQHDVWCKVVKCLVAI